MPILFVLFIVVPIVEMYILIKVGAMIGGLYTIALVLATALIGVSLLKKQGLSTFINAQQKMQTGQMPITEIAEGLMLAEAGALLMTPGFVTDTVGFILLTPVLRQLIAKRFFQAWLLKAQVSGSYRQTSYRESCGRSTFDESGIIDGEFKEVEDEKIEKK